MNTATGRLAASVLILAAVLLAQHAGPALEGVTLAEAAETVPGQAGPALPAGVTVAADPASGQAQAGGQDTAAVVSVHPSGQTGLEAALRPPLGAPTIWRGTVGQAAWVRAEPSRTSQRLGELQPGQPIQVVDWVRGEAVERDNPTWAQLADGRYIYSTLLRSGPLAIPPARPADAPSEGRWIDVNLTLQTATAYEGARPLRSVLVSTGQPGWDTPRGTFTILRRVPKETMDGSTLVGQGPNGAGASYKVENVRHTQYFTADGAAIHENYWRNPATFGIPGSHGCIGMLPDDAAWFWQFATVGTPVVIH
jgi:lipoprotein-anchoring transpeptidase ErfK/SrfK